MHLVAWESGWSFRKMTLHSTMPCCYILYWFSNGSSGTVPNSHFAFKSTCCIYFTRKQKNAIKVPFHHGRKYSLYHIATNYNWIPVRFVFNTHRNTAFRSFLIMCWLHMTWWIENAMKIMTIFINLASLTNCICIHSFAHRPLSEKNSNQTYQTNQIQWLHNMNDCHCHRESK